MLPFKSFWNRLTSDYSSGAPEKDQQTIVCDGLIAELEHQVRELGLEQRELHNKKIKEETGVDYSWLVSVPRKNYEVPQLERLELEALFYKVRPAECSQVLSLFRDAVLNHPKVQDLPKIMKACVHQVIERRPKEESLADWMIKKSLNFGSLRFRPHIRVSPDYIAKDPEEDLQTGESCARNVTDNCFHEECYGENGAESFSV